MAFLVLLFAFTNAEIFHFKKDRIFQLIFPSKTYPFPRCCYATPPGVVYEVGVFFIQLSKFCDW